jgi:predicted cupin superfamily sugar epimerase
MTAEDVKKLLRLELHPREGGWFTQTYAANESIPPELFPGGRYKGARRSSTAIYYLLESDTFSEIHRLRSDEIFHFYVGDAVEMLQLMPGGVGRTFVIGNDLLRGQQPQVLVERGVWQGSRLASGGSWALLGCTVAPGFEYEDYDSASRSELTARWPEFAELIAVLTRH